MPISSYDEYQRTKIEAEKIEQAIAAARGRPPSPGVDPRVHEAHIQALESELALLRDHSTTTRGATRSADGRDAAADRA